MKTRSTLFTRRWWSLLLMLLLITSGPIRSAVAQDAAATTYLPVVSSSTAVEQQTDTAPASDTVAQPDNAGPTTMSSDTPAETDTTMTTNVAETFNPAAPSFDRDGNFSLTGKLGVGTNTPAEAITINAGPARFRINDFRSLLEGGGDPAFIFYTRSSPVGSLFFEDAAKNRLRLRVGPGIPGNGGGNGTNDLVIEQAASGNNIPLYISSHGSVGMSTTTPKSRLHVVADGAASGITVESSLGVAGIRLVRTGDTNGVNDVSIAARPDADGGGLGIYTYNPTTQNRLRILANGNVGIGTITPSRQLEVAGDLMLSSGSGGPGDLRMDNPTGGYGGVALSGTSNDRLVINASQSFNHVLMQSPVVMAPSSLANPTVFEFLNVYGRAYKSTGGMTWTNTSDERIKKNITTFSDGLDVLMEINPVRFQYNGLGGT